VFNAISGIPDAWELNARYYAQERPVWDEAGGHLVYTLL
jgi:hypothetical protein